MSIKFVSDYIHMMCDSIYHGKGGGAAMIPGKKRLFFAERVMRY
jgi:hypothetical protein